MTRVAYVNGRYLPHGQARVHIEDRGYQFADGVYEVAAVIGGRLVDLAPHLARLERSLREVRMAAPMGLRALEAVMREMVRRNKVRNGLVYLQITRGVARRDHAFPAHAEPSLVITAKHLDPAAEAARTRGGIAVVSTPETRWARCDIKSTGLLPNVLAKQQAREAGASEAWFVDEDGFVVEGASSNAWIVDGEGRIVTRELSHALLPGVTRLTLIAAARAAGIEVVERAFTLEEALNAREAFITSATNFATPVIRIDDRVIGNGAPGSIAERLRMLYLEKALPPAA